MARSRLDSARRVADGSQMENPSTNASVTTDGQVKRPSDWPHKEVWIPDYRHPFESPKDCFFRALNEFFEQMPLGEIA